MARKNSSAPRSRVFLRHRRRLAVGLHHRLAVYLQASASSRVPGGAAPELKRPRPISSMTACTICRYTGVVDSHRIGIATPRAAAWSHDAWTARRITIEPGDRGDTARFMHRAGASAANRRPLRCKGAVPRALKSEGLLEFQAEGWGMVLAPLDASEQRCSYPHGAPLPLAADQEPAGLLRRRTSSELQARRRRVVSDTI